MFDHLIVVGAGGIASHLLDAAARMISSYEDAPRKMFIVDGDHFSESNLSRQNMVLSDINQMKAQVAVDRLTSRFPNLEILSISEFITRENAEYILLDKSIVLSCVDNHATRLLISEEVRRKEDVIVISGSNEVLWGNTHIYLVLDGQERSMRIEKAHPEIENPEDRNPGEMSCQEREALPGGGQIISTNHMAASWMIAYLEMILLSMEKGKERIVKRTAANGEVFFNLEGVRAISHNRQVRRKPKRERATK